MYRIVFNILITNYFKPRTRALPVSRALFMLLNMIFWGFGTAEFMAEKGGQLGGVTDFSSATVVNFGRIQWIIVTCPVEERLNFGSAWSLIIPFNDATNRFGVFPAKYTCLLLRLEKARGQTWAWKPPKAEENCAESESRWAQGAPKLSAGRWGKSHDSWRCWAQGAPLISYIGLICFVLVLI